MTNENTYENGYFGALDDMQNIIEKSENYREAVDKIIGYIQGAKIIKNIQIVMKNEERE